MSVLLPAEAKGDLLSGAFVCRQLERCLCRSLRRADGNIDRNRGLEEHHAILNTSRRMDGLFPPYLLIFLTRMIIATLQICQVVPARRCTSRKVWSDAKLMKMTANVSAQHLEYVPTPTIQRLMSSTTSIMDKWLQRWSMCQTYWHLVGRWQQHSTTHFQPDSMQSQVRQWILRKIWNEVSKLVTMSCSTYTSYFSVFW